MFETEEDIWDEFDRFCEFIPKHHKETGEKRTLGQELYYAFERTMGVSRYITEDWMFELVHDINNSMALEIPIAANLQDCPIRIEDYGAFIKEEIQAIRNGS